MVPRERKKARPSAVVETYRESSVTDEEWEAFFQRSLAFRPQAADAPATGKLTVFLTPEAMAPAAPVVVPRLPDLAGARLPEGSDLRLPGAAEESLPGGAAEAVAACTPEPAPAPQPSAAAALTEQEWRERFFQRGRLTGLLDGEDVLILTVPDAAGSVTSLRLQGSALASVAAAALRQGAAGFDWRDHDDLVLLGIVLDSCLRGVPLESRPAAVQIAVHGMAQRYAALLGRLEALLPPR